MAGTRYVVPAAPGIDCNPRFGSTCRFWFQDEDSDLINNRQNGRRRGRGGGPQRQGGGGGQGQRDSGNRIDSRARGNAAQLLEKYKNMARDAQLAGDRVNTEYCLQFADHYFRVLADQRGRSDDQYQPRRQRDDFDQFDDDDFGDEGEPVRAEEQARASEQDGARRDRGRDDGRDAGRDGGRDAVRGAERPRGEARDDRRNGYAAEGEERRNGRSAEATEDRRQAVTAPANDIDEAMAATVSEDDPAPRRRRARKPREENVAVPADEPAALGADRLPPALGIPASEGEPTVEGEEAPKPRRRRVRSVTSEARPVD